MTVVKKRSDWMEDSQCGNHSLYCVCRIKVTNFL